LKKSAYSRLPFVKLMKAYVRPTMITAYRDADLGGPGLLGKKRRSLRRAARVPAGQYLN
jgi:hypothetical protein